MEAAFFDLDKTVITKASMVAFGGPFYRGGLISRRTVLRALWGQLIYLHLGASEQRLSRIRESVLTLTTGWERSKVLEIVGEALEETVEPIIFNEALELMEAHRAAGRRIFIVSASPEEIVIPLGNYIGSDEVIASRPTVDERDRYTGEMDFYAYGEYKAEAMRELAETEGIDLSSSFAYSDSYTDAPMLEAVGHPVAVNPDRVLLKLARERGWEVRRFEQPVRLKARVTVPERPGAATAVAFAGAAGAAVVVWRLSARRGGGQSERSFLAANTPRVTSTATRRSFFMDSKASVSRAGLAWPLRLADHGLAPARRSARPEGIGRWLAAAAAGSAAAAQARLRPLAASVPRGPARGRVVAGWPRWARRASPPRRWWKAPAPSRRVPLLGARG